MKKLSTFQAARAGMALVLALALTLSPYTLAGRQTRAQAAQRPLTVLKAEDYLTVAGHTFRVLSVSGGSGVVISAHMPTETVNLDSDGESNAAAVNAKVAAFAAYFAKEKSFIGHFGILNGSSRGESALTFGGAVMNLPASLAEMKIVFKDGSLSNDARYGYAYGGGVYAASGHTAAYVLMGGMVSLAADGFGVTDGTGSKTSPFVIGAATGGGGAPAAYQPVSATIPQPLIDYSDYEEQHLWLYTPRGTATILNGMDYENYFKSGVFNPDDRGVTVRFQTDIPLEGTTLTLPAHVKFNQVSMVAAEDVVDHKGRPVNLSQNIAVDKNSGWQRNMIVSDNTITFDGLGIDTKLRASADLLIVLSVQAGYEGDIYLTADNQAREYYTKTKIATARNAADVYTKAKWGEMTMQQQAVIEMVLGRKVTWNSNRDFIIVENEPGALKEGRQLVISLNDGLFFKDGFAYEAGGGLKLTPAEVQGGSIVATVKEASVDNVGSVTFTSVTTDKEPTAALGWHGIFLVGDAVADNLGAGPGQFEAGAVEAPYIQVYPKG